VAHHDRIKAQQAGIIQQFSLELPVMRRKFNPQLDLFMVMAKNQIAKEL
jgi:hypothetical protein